MSQRLLVNKFEWIEDTIQFNKDFIKKVIMKKVIKNIFPKLMFLILKNYMDFIIICHFLPERMKIEKVEKLDTSLRDKTEYAIHIRKLVLALSHGLFLKKVYIVIKSNQNAWLKQNIDMNIDMNDVNIDMNILI